MQEIFSDKNIPNLSELGNVIPELYNYYKKIVTPGLLLNVKGACFKWYNLYPADTEIIQEQVQEAREFIKSETIAGRLVFEGELGFVILHRAGEYLLLIVTTWRLINELWESIYFKKVTQPGSYAPLKFENVHKGTYCVWELGAIWHERNAWVRFIESNRDEVAKLAYLNDLFSGTV
jgi:uncharacterized phage-associated protein